MRTLFELAADLGCREAWVLTERENSAAVRLYESLGGSQPSAEPVMFSFAITPAGAASDSDRGTP